MFKKYILFCLTSLFVQAGNASSAECKTYFTSLTHALNDLKENTRITRQEAQILRKRRYALVRDGGICANASVCIAVTAMRRFFGDFKARVNPAELIRITDKASNKFNIDGRKDGLLAWQIKQLLIDEANDYGINLKVKIVDMEKAGNQHKIVFKEDPNIIYIFASHVYTGKKDPILFKWGHAVVAYNFNREKMEFQIVDPLHPAEVDLRANLTKSEYDETIHQFQIHYDQFVRSYPKKPLNFLGSVIVVEFN
ncbi:MAG: hypothetical protein IPM57_10370 [Oligoflexia bacterium]|nr:hypothetical protein [Oligoflexia bacterium]